MLKKLRTFFISKQKQGKFVCSCCGKQYSEWPALVYNSPVYYSYLSEEDKKNIAELTSDICVINHPDRVDRFVRGVLKIKIINSCRFLEYGIWVSLSENSFDDYIENYDNDEREGGYFGWTSNNIEGYENTLSIASDVFLQPNGYRPNIVPHKDNDHPLVVDYYNGITITEAEKRINKVLGF